MTKPFNFRMIYMLLFTAVVLFLAPSTALAQKKEKRNGDGKAYVAASIIKPAPPTPMSVRERNIRDLLYYPYGCLPAEVDTREEAQAGLTEAFGGAEIINGDIGIHANEAFDYTYLGVQISVCYASWFDNRHWYHFYFDSRKAAEDFYVKCVAEIKSVGIPLTKDKIYGGVSNRKHPVYIFKWVSVSTPTIVKDAYGGNIYTPDVVGKYCVELAVYKRPAR